MSTAVEINAPRIVHDEIDREIIAIDLATGTYFSMQASARALWLLLAQGPVGIDQVTEALLASYRDAPSVAGGEVRAFIDHLVGQQLLRRGAVGGEKPSPLREDLGPYGPPVVEAFTDMQELVLLDPVHDVDAVGWPSRPAPPEA